MVLLNKDLSAYKILSLSVFFDTEILGSHSATKTALFHQAGPAGEHMDLCHCFARLGQQIKAQPRSCHVVRMLCHDDQLRLEGVY